MLKKMMRALFGRPDATPEGPPPVKYPGLPAAVDGNTAVVRVEREAADACGAYATAPTTAASDGWVAAADQGHVNVAERPLVFVRPESEHAAAAVTAGFAMAGLRATNFSSGPGMAFMHEALYTAAGKRLPYVLNVGCRAMTKAALSLHAGHDDYHSVADTGFIQVMAKDAQEAADLNLIARKTAELALTPAIVGQDGVATTHCVETIRLPERELIAEYLGRPDDLIATPTRAQQMLYGPTRPRVPAIWDVDLPLASGTVQNQDAYMQATIAQRPYFFDHIADIAERCMAEYAELTGRRYGRVGTYRTDDADYLIVGMGSLIVQAEAVADYLRATRGLKVGVVNVTLFRPFPGDLLSQLLKGRKGVAVLERTDQPLAEDLPLIREIRAALTKSVENGAGGQVKLHNNHEAYREPGDLPPLYSGCYGLGGRELQPEGLIGAVENMLPEGAGRRFYYLSVDFVGDGEANALLEAYPQLRTLGLKGSENPNLLPADVLAVRLQATGGAGATSAGQELANTLAQLTGWHVKGLPQREMEMTGQPTRYHLAAAPQPIRVQGELPAVDVVLSSDPCVLTDVDTIASLKKGGVLVVQSALPTPAAVWDAFPLRAQTEIIDRKIRVFYLDAAKIAREEATGADFVRAEGAVFQGAFFAASSFLAARGLSADRLFQKLEAQMDEASLRALRRGFGALTEITVKTIGFNRKLELQAAPPLPAALARRPAATADAKTADLQQFWQQTGTAFACGRGSQTPADPLASVALMPAASGILRDMSRVRLTHPAWLPEKCTACGDCYTACPDAAIPGLVTPVADVFATALRRIEADGAPAPLLRRALPRLEKETRQAIAAGTAARAAIAAALQAVAAGTAEAERAALDAEIERFNASLGAFQFAATEAFFTAPEGAKAGSGALFSLTVNPNACKGCGICVEACGEGALQMVAQTRDTTHRLRADWSFWLDLPNSPAAVSRGATLPALLLDKRSYGALVGGDGACRGCGEKSAVHLFAATVAARMQPRVEAFVAKLDDLIGRLQVQIGMKLTASVDVANTQALLQAVETSGEATLATLAERAGGQAPIDAAWLKRVAPLLAALKDLRWRYVAGPTGDGRCQLGVVNATGCSAMWGASYPYNPYPFPWTSHLFQDSTSLAMGIFEGHMVKMADAFKTVRRAELELSGAFADGVPEDQQDVFRRFDWQQFSDEEWALCPPVVAIGGADAMIDNGFQNLSRVMMSGKPVKIVVLDKQARSTVAAEDHAGHVGNASARLGLDETPKEIALVGMAHRAAFVLQSTVAHPAHLLQGFIEGIDTRRPAVFNLYAACPPKHGLADDGAVNQSRLAVESRAFPLFKYNPDLGTTFSECVSLDGNPDVDRDWPVYTLEYQGAQGEAEAMQLPLTFADFAATEGRFARDLQAVAAEGWSDDMLPLADYLKLAVDERAARRPFIWALDGQRRLTRLLVSQRLTCLSEDRLRFWGQIKDVVGLQPEEFSPTIMAERLRRELVAKVLADLGVALPDDGSNSAPTVAESALPAAVSAAASESPANGNGYEPVSIDSAECTACDECIGLAPNAFAYNAAKQATVVDSRGATFAAFVKAAEKCTASCIRPGTPWNMGEPGVEKLMARAEKFN